MRKASIVDMTFFFSRNKDALVSNLIDLDFDAM